VSEDHTLRMERTYRAPAEAVFDAWTSEEVLRRWWKAERGWEAPEATVEARVGGVIRVVMRDTDGDSHGGGGTYTEVARPSRLAFTWTWDDSDRETLIEVDFEPTETGGTKVNFTHSLLADEATVRDHEYGWGNILDELGRVLEAG
jgi:uncharacterized protein YndB with AHSA1/START domain